MPSLHDYICKECDIVVLDSYEKVSCPCCENCMDITYENWTDMAVPNHGRPSQEHEDHNGFRKMFNALEDPIASIELGLINDPASRGLRTFTSTQAEDYRRRLRVDGDSPKLRRGILRTRSKNESDAGINPGYETI